MVTTDKDANRRNSAQAQGQKKEKNRSPDQSQSRNRNVSVGSTVSSTPSKSKGRGIVARKPAHAPARSWPETFAANTESLETRLEEFVVDRPLAAVGCALGLGAAAFYGLSKISSAAPKGRRGTSPARKDPGILGAGVAPMLTRIQSEFDRIAIDGLASARENIVDFVSTEFSERPIETLGTAISIGYGLGSLRPADLKQGALRFAKLLAVKAMDGNALSRNPETEGDTHEYPDDENPLESKVH